ncbi:MAG: formylglycine-generating enzyme family protein [Acidobacteriia bacterium]|nr:formylglycine-generating enzyme family protein [Terriglobia bacterium]
MSPPNHVTKLFIEGLVPIDTLPGDEYTDQENVSASRLEPADLVRVPGGGFLMGQEDARDDERPAHSVTVGPFLLCRFQTTNAHWEAFRRATMRDKPEFTCPTQPVTSVNWFDAVAYCRWLSKAWGRHFRLPTEAEWEFAARGGLERKLYPWGDDPPESRPDYAARWREGPEPVATSEPNGYGLFDLCENVHEWCCDWYDPAYYAASPLENPPGPVTGKRRASRGGAWRHHVKIARCAARSSIPPEFRYSDYGFRLAADVA